LQQHPLTVEIRPQAGSVTLDLAGELDLATCGTLRACLEQLDPGFQEVVLDLSRVSFVDSTGLSLFVTAQQEMAARGGRLVMRGPCGHVRKVLEVSGVDQVLSVQA
jgi:anti-sigma B factor antagonist